MHSGIKQMRILIIIPAYNEEKNIQAVHNTICKCNEGNDGHRYDYVFINDGSTDRTLHELISCNAEYVSLAANLGIGGAVQTGYKYALENGYDIAVQMDGDGQHDIHCINTILEPVEKGECDMAIGSRFVGKNAVTFRSSYMRRIGIKIISGVIWIKTGKRILDTTSGFRAVNKKLIEEFARDYPTEYPEPISSVFALKNGYRVAEFPVTMHERKSGVSSIRAWKDVYYMVNVILSIILVKKRQKSVTK